MWSTHTKEHVSSRRDRAPSWRAAFVLSLGGTLLVTVSLGSMAGEIGVTSIIAWSITSLVGVLICLLLAEFARIYPTKVGGAPAYIHESFKQFSPLVSALAAWSYWAAWIPGVAVNLTLAAQYITFAFLPGVPPLLLTLILFVLLYTINYFGLPFGTLFSFIAALCAIIPLVLIVGVACTHPQLWHFTSFAPLSFHHFSWHTLFPLWKWMFVAAWSSYGAEMIASVVGELRNPVKDGPKSLYLAAIAGWFAFTFLPIMLIALVGVNGLTHDPMVVFLTAAHDLFGPLGTTIISIMLIAALILGAQIFVISSSRALYQMSRDGLMHPSYQKVNQYGVPVGSMGWDALVTFTLLLIFQGNIIHVVAAANVSYLFVFILFPLAYLLMKRKNPSQKRMPSRVLSIIAVFLLVFNCTLLLLGGLQWGLQVMSIGLLLIVCYIPCYFLLQKNVGRKVDYQRSKYDAKRTE